MKKKFKVIVRIKGGLGNQLFIYCAARRLAYVNDAQLIIDNVTGLIRNLNYPRKYNLNHFNITAPLANSQERLFPFERVRRFILKTISYFMSFSNRPYIFETVSDFDQKLVDLKVKKNIYLDGYWQSERYFKDIEPVIRSDLIITPPKDELNKDMYRNILNCKAPVAVHVRWFELSGTPSQSNASLEYYKNALDYISNRLPELHFFVFSEDIKATLNLLNLPEGKFTAVSHNITPDMAYADLWLMSNCKHFIIANSTFSWWGAWLGNHTDKIVICPSIKKDGLGAWGFNGLIPDEWIKI